VNPAERDGTRIIDLIDGAGGPTGVSIPRVLNPPGFSTAMPMEGERQTATG
jgi:hypothetical protein